MALECATFIVTLYTKQRSSVICTKDTIITNLDTLTITGRLICIAIADVQAMKAVVRSGKDERRILFALIAKQISLLFQQT